MNKKRIFNLGFSGVRWHLKNSNKPKRSYEEKVRTKLTESKSKERVPDEWDNWYPWES